MEREVHLPEGTIRYTEEGEGEPLVFIHGLGVNRLLWRNVVPRLSGQYRCITPDWPMGGHTVALAPHADLSLPGLARLTISFLDALGLERATLVGNDSGGAVAQMVAVLAPERVDRMVLNSCELYERFLPPFFKPFQLGAALPGSVFVVSQLLRFRWFQWLAGFGRSVARGMPSREIMDSYTRSGRESAGVRRDTKKFLRSVDPRYTLETAEKLTTFEKPVLVVWGRQDRLFPLDYPRRFAASLPDARLEIVEDCATFAPEDQPEQLAALIAAFVAETAGQGGAPSRAAPEGA